MAKASGLARGNVHPPFRADFAALRKNLRSDHITFPSPQIRLSLTAGSTRRRRIPTQQLMLQKGWKSKSRSSWGCDHDQRSGDGIFRGHRNGYEDKQVQTAEGPLHLKMPQVRDTIEAFDSVWLLARVRRSDKLAALIRDAHSICASPWNPVLATSRRNGSSGCIGRPGAS
jgi:hypothetical protein